MGRSVSPGATASASLSPLPASLDGLLVARGWLAAQDRAALLRARAGEQRRTRLGPGPCPTHASARIFVFPLRPRAGDTLRLVALSEKGAHLGRLSAHLGKGPLALSRGRRFLGPPASLVARATAVRPGLLRIRLTHRRTGRTTACARIRILDARSSPPPGADYAEVWPVTRAWDQWMERLYSAWIGRLFFVPAGGVGSWFPLHQATRDPSRNWLHNALGRAEDSSSGVKVILTPDCADTPYFLRAYFAWKLGLPFMFQRCTRGNAVTGPQCPQARSNLVTRYGNIYNPVRRFNAFVREWVGWAVHSGTTRTLASDDSSDFYPVALTRSSLRPGRIFVDPAGHVFVVSQQRPGTSQQLGLLFGIDGHPDRTVSRKRFSRGTFVYNHRYKTGGFKAFRPVVFEGGRIRHLSNAEILARHGDFSLEQTSLATSRAFYDRVQEALNPYPLRPRQVYASKIRALHEALLERVKAVALGVAFMERNQWRPVQIPRGPAIFETTGTWERFSTPARDLRLLMAIRDVLRFPQEVLRRRHLYRIPPGWSDARLLSELQRVGDALLETLTISYVRSDRTVKTLTLAQVIERRDALRMAYNPNDCIEIRWGAPLGSAELSTCRRRAMKEQRDKMRSYRVWFQLLRRPAING